MRSRRLREVNRLKVCYQQKVHWGGVVALGKAKRYSVPIQDQPGVHPDWGVKSVKTNSALRRPFAAMAKMVTMSATTPANGQNTANVCRSC